MPIAELALGSLPGDVVYRLRISPANHVTYRSEFLCGEAVTCTEASHAQRTPSHAHISLKCVVYRIHSSSDAVARSSSSAPLSHHHPTSSHLSPSPIPSTLLPPLPRLADPARLVSSARRRGWRPRSTRSSSRTSSKAHSASYAESSRTSLF